MWKKIYLKASFIKGTKFLLSIFLCSSSIEHGLVNQQRRWKGLSKQSIGGANHCLQTIACPPPPPCFVSSEDSDASVNQWSSWTILQHRDQSATKFPGLGFQVLILSPKDMKKETEQLCCLTFKGFGLEYTVLPPQKTFTESCILSLTTWAESYNTQTNWMGEKISLAIEYNFVIKYPTCKAHQGKASWAESER